MNPDFALVERWN